MKMPTITTIREELEEVVPCMYSGQLHHYGDIKKKAKLIHNVLTKLGIKYNQNAHRDWVAEKYPDYNTYAVELLNDFTDWRFLRKSDFAQLDK